MINELISIIFKSLKLEKNLYNNSKNFGEAAIYFSSIIVIIAGLSSIIPQNIFIQTLGLNYNINNIEPTSIKFALFGSLFGWFALSLYIYVIGIKFFPSKKTNCNFLKVLTNPYEDQKINLDYFSPADPNKEKYQTFCGT